ncbi:MAG: CDP-glycerol glycerophosphotransferase family protein [Deltaproteobacteria bacterium]|nr:CDP-glycerol glycerophosphotransferase family protein [Deltaproteobacteria bacterium]
MSVAFASAFSFLLPYVLPGREGRVVITSFHGRGYRGSPRALFEHLIATGRLDPIWLATEPAIVRDLQGKFGAERAALAHSARGVLALATARAIVISHGTSDLPWLHLHSKAALVQTFHGLPTKGGELLGPRPKLASRLAYWRRFRGIDHFVSSSPLVSRIFGARFGLPPWVFLEIGYPSHDGLLRRPPERVDTSSLWPDAPRHSRLILWAPTFRTRSLTRFLPFEDFDAAALSAFLEEIDALLCLRPHPNDQLDLEPVRLLSPRIVVADHGTLEDVQPLLPACDVVVTDYSGTYLEALLVDVPVVFVPYDRDSYERDLPLDYDATTPGPKVATQAELLDACRRALADPAEHRAARATIRRLYFRHDDAGATERLADFIATIAGDTGRSDAPSSPASPEGARRSGPISRHRRP